MPIAVLINKCIVSFIVIFGALSFPVASSCGAGPAVNHYANLRIYESMNLRGGILQC